MPRTPTPPASRGTGSPHALRRRNQELLIEALRLHGPSTQTTLARTTGLAAATISNLVKILEDENLVRTRNVIQSGRRAVEIALRVDDTLAVGFDVGRSELRTVISKLDHEIVVEKTIDLPQGHRPSQVIELSRALLRDLLASNALDPRNVGGIGMGIPTAIGADQKALDPDQLLPHWHDVDLPELAQNAFDIPVILDNDANLGALAHRSFGPYSSVDNLVFINVGVGIGAGVIAGGQLIRGHSGGAGEIGHLPVLEGGNLCFCGNRGCLTSVASTTAIDTALSQTRLGRNTSEIDIVTLARNRDITARRILEDAGICLGFAVAAVCNVLNPEIVIIGGPLAPIGAQFLDPINRGMARRTLPSVALNTQLTMSHLGSRAGVLGAACLAMQQISIASL